MLSRRAIGGDGIAHRPRVNLFEREVFEDELHRAGVDVFVHECRPCVPIERRTERALKFRKFNEHEWGGRRASGEPHVDFQWGFGKGSDSRRPGGTASAERVPQ
jgi:hypothetical protein